MMENKIKVEKGIGSDDFYINHYETTIKDNDKYVYIEIHTDVKYVKEFGYSCGAYVFKNNTLLCGDNEYLKIILPEEFYKKYNIETHSIDFMPFIRFDKFEIQLIFIKRLKNDN